MALNPKLKQSMPGMEGWGASTPVSSTPKGTTSTPAANTAQQLGEMVTIKLPTVTASAPNVVVGAPAKKITGTPRILPTESEIKQKDVLNTQPTDFTSLYAQLQNLIMPKQQKIPEYTSPYASQINTALANWQSKTNTPFVYNPATDAGLKSAQEQAQQQTMREFARKNLLGSMSNEAQSQLAAMNLIPEYQQMARNQYNTETQNLYNNLNLLNDLETQNYNRYRTGVADANTNFTNQLSTNKTAMELAQSQIENEGKATVDQTKAQKDTLKELGYTQLPSGEIVPSLEREKFTATQQKDLETSEKNKFGLVLNDTARQYNSAYESLYNDDEGFRNDIASNYGNLALLRDKYLANGDQEAADAVQGARLLKIINDPNLLVQYGYEFGLSNTDIKKKAAELDKAQLDAVNAKIETAMKSIDFSVYEEETQLRMEKAFEDLQNRKYDNYIKNIQASFIEPQLKQELINAGLQARNIENQINNRDINTSLARSRYLLEVDRETNKAPTKTELDNRFNELLEEYRGYSFDKAYQALKQNENKLLGTFGPEGFNEFYNAVLGKVFEANKNAKKVGGLSGWEYITPKPIAGQE